MSENAGETTSNQLILLPEDSHASLLVQPGSNEARTMTATSGRSLSALLTKLDPVGLLLKMCLESESYTSTLCYLTWKGWATPMRRSLYRLVPSTPRIDVTGSGLLPTMTEYDATGKGNMRKEAKPEVNHAISLHHYVKMYQTPMPSDVDGGRTTKGKKRQNETGIRRQVGGQLNPTWVEWLMGFPLGWTDLEHLETL
jgi:hypothetical protein